MEIEQIASYTWLIGVLGASTSFLLAVYSIWRFKQRAKAEKKLVRIITTGDDALRCFYEVTHHDQNLNLCRYYIKESSKKLDFNERKKIMEGLNQPSKHGQEEYIKKIINSTKQMK